MALDRSEEGFDWRHVKDLVRPGKFTLVEEGWNVFATEKSVELGEGLSELRAVNEFDHVLSTAVVFWEVFCEELLRTLRQLSDERLQATRCEYFLKAAAALRFLSRRSWHYDRRE